MGATIGATAFTGKDETSVPEEVSGTLA